MRMKLSKYHARLMFGSDYSIAKHLDIHQSAVSRWGKYVPDDRVTVLLSVPEHQRRLKRGGLRVKK